VIQGGSGSGSRNIALAPAASSTNKQSSYGITIVANGASGGGFKDFGVFQNEAAYTVYIDMSDAGTRANWTLQYALDTHPAGASANRSRSLLVPPYATSKLLPHFSAEAANRNHGSVIVVFGVISSHGNFEGLRVLQSPDPSFNRLLLDCLARWAFRPAEVDGTAVSVKVLLGVPVSSVPQNASAPSTGSIQVRAR
jgi:TonB family protein